MIGNVFLNPHGAIGRAPPRVPLPGDWAIATARGERPSRSPIAVPPSTNSSLLVRASPSRASGDAFWWTTGQRGEWAESETKYRKWR
jgi:hypothetical protein